MLGFGDRFVYIDPFDKSRDEENVSQFYLRPLSVQEVYDVDGALSEDRPKPGTRTRKLIKYGLVGWSNFIPGDRSAEEVFDGDVEICYHAKMVSWIPVNTRESIARQVYALSVLSSDVENELKNVVRTVHLKHKSPNDNVWDCDVCIAEGYHVRRKCSKEGVEETQKPSHDYSKKYKPIWEQGKKKKPKNAPHGNHIYEQCPVGLTSNRAWALYGIIKECEAVNVLPCNPPVLMEQPYVFFQAKKIISHEEYVVEKRRGDESDNSPGMPGTTSGAEALAKVRNKVTTRRPRRK